MDESLHKKSKSPLGAVIIILDTVRADHVSCYGHNRQTTPAIDALAKKSVLFEQVISSSPWTLPSIGTMLSCQSIFNTASKHGMLQRSVIEEFSKAGLVTAAVTEGGFFSKHFQMDRGFEYYHEEEGPIKLIVDGKRLNDEAGPEANISRTFKNACQWLEKNKDKPFLLFIHTYEPHAPYTCRYFTDKMELDRIGDIYNPGYLNDIRNGTLPHNGLEKQYIHALYDSGIYSCDCYVGKFLEFLKKTDLDDKTLIAVTSDHGEELGEHHQCCIYDHGHSLKDDLLKVPLILHDPTRKFPVDRVNAQVRLSDILVTIADLLGVEIPYPTESQSLVDFMTNKETSDRLVLSGQTRFGPKRICIRNGQYKYIETLAPGKDTLPLNIPQRQLYNLLEDPAEKINLAEFRPEIAKTMCDLLHQQMINKKPVTDVQPKVSDEKVRQRLNSLGYL